jgi:hypothetical protein
VTAAAVGPHPDLIKAIVSFSFSEKPPFDKLFTGETTAGTVLTEAMVYFEAQPEPGHDYYLTHDRERVQNSATLGSLRHHDHELTFRMVKEIPQG